MDFSLNNAKAQKVWFDDDNLLLLLIDGRQLSVPISFFPTLAGASKKNQNEYE